MLLSGKRRYSRQHLVRCAHRARVRLAAATKAIRCNDTCAGSMPQLTPQPAQPFVAPVAQYTVSCTSGAPASCIVEGFKLTLGSGANQIPNSNCRASGGAVGFHGPLTNAKMFSYCRYSYPIGCFITRACKLLPCTNTDAVWRPLSRSYWCLYDSAFCCCTEQSLQLTTAVRGRESALTLLSTTVRSNIPFSVVWRTADNQVALRTMISILY